jgi:hypothetical protein
MSVVILSTLCEWSTSCIIETAKRYMVLEGGFLKIFIDYVVTLSRSSLNNLGPLGQSQIHI